MFRHLTAAFVLGVLALSSAASAQTATVTSGGGPTVQQAQQESAFGPKARIAVAQFKDKTGKGWWTGAIGDGMADMLSTALFNTNRFIVLERQVLRDVMQEQDLGASGRIKQLTAAPVGEMEGAELLVAGAVTEFQPGTRGGRAGIGGGGLGLGGMILGGIAGGINESHIAIDMRLIDTKTSRVVAAMSVEGKARDFDIGGALGGVGGAVGLGGALGIYSKTPMEKALRIAINEAVAFVSNQTPAQYYRVTAPAPATAMPGTITPTSVTPAAPPAPALPAAPVAAPEPRPAAPAATMGAAKPSVEERLLKLDELRKKNLLTDDEYKRKREEVLKDL